MSRSEMNHRRAWVQEPVAATLALDAVLCITACRSAHFVLFVVIAYACNIDGAVVGGRIRHELYMCGKPGLVSARAYSSLRGVAGVAIVRPTPSVRNVDALPNVEISLVRRNAYHSVEISWAPPREEPPAKPHPDISHEIGYISCIF